MNLGGFIDTYKEALRATALRQGTLRTPRPSVWRGLQVVHHIANGYKDFVSGVGTPADLTFVNSRDLTIDQHVV